MKKRKILSLLFAVTLLFSLMAVPAGATSGGRSSSELLDSMEVQAKAALLVDVDTGTVLYAQNADEKVYPASTTKMLAAVCVMRAIEDGQLSMSQKITAQEDCWTGLNTYSSNANIKPGEILTVQELLECLMIPSANEAANILGEAVSGSIDGFVDLMNQTAAELGCTGTHFANTHGMHNEDHYTTCTDLAIIAKEALRYEDLRTIMSSKECYIEATNVSERRHYFNTNGLLSNLKYSGYVYSKCIGIKTGSTDEAGYCLVSAAESNGQTLIAVVMGCENPKDSAGKVQRLQFSESSRLLEWGFDSFHVIEILDQTQPQGTVPVTMSDTDYVTVVADQTITAQLPTDITAEMIRREVSLISEVEAPVKKGDVLGSMTLSLDGVDYGTVNLVAVNDVEVNEFLLRKAQIEDLIGKWWMKVVALIVGVIVVIVLLRIFVFRPKGNRYGSSGRRRSGGSYRGGRRR